MYVSGDGDDSCTPIDAIDTSFGGEAKDSEDVWCRGAGRTCCNHGQMDLSCRGSVRRSPRVSYVG